MRDTSAPTRPPRCIAIVREARVLLDAARMLTPLAAAHIRKGVERLSPHVIVIPGFG